MGSRCLVVGAGVSGLVAAKELIEVGIDDLVILEKEESLGGVWTKYCWHSTTLTSSKWTTEFGSYPMPEDYPDFLKPGQMMDYLRSFARHFDLEERVNCGVACRAIQKNDDGTFDVATSRGVHQGCDFVVISTGLHGVPKLPSIPGFDDFPGEVFHGSEYRTPDPFRNKRVLCVGLGESGIGINSEISSVAAHTIVSATSFTFAPRIFPRTNNAFEHMQFWPIGRFMKDYQEGVTLAMSWYHRLPSRLQPAYAQFHPVLRLIPKEWRPKALLPYHWHGKYWPKAEGPDDPSGNVTRPETPTDDILYLVKAGRIQPKGRVVGFDQSVAVFEDGSRAEIDALVLNTGYEPNVHSISFPGGWKYRHQELYKGVFHPRLPNIAFVGMVRPTIGSIPAMAEMQSRFMAQIFAGLKQLPPQEELEQIVASEHAEHARECDTMMEHFPHVYFFDEWMEEMAELVGCRSRIWHHLTSWKKLQAYLFGSAMPLRFRMRGPGAEKDGYKRYADRIAQIYGTKFGRKTKYLILMVFLYPHLLALLLGAILFFVVKLPALLSAVIAVAFWLLYMTVDLFRFAMWLPNLFVVNRLMAQNLVENCTPGAAGPLPVQRQGKPASCGVPELEKQS